MLKNEPPKTPENVNQFTVVNPTIRSPLPEELDFISAPELPFKIPFVSDERARYWLFSVIVFRYYARYWLLRITKSPFGYGFYILSILGCFTSMRAFYKDQLFTYGLRNQLPGIAHQIQTQHWPTFHFVTCPELVTESRRLFGPVPASPSSTYVFSTTSTLVPTNSPFVHFLETPFLERLDFYPHAAVIQFSEYWTDLLTNRYIGTWDAMIAQDPASALRQIPQQYSIQTLHPLEFAHPAERTVRDPWGTPHVDPWGAERTRMDLSDELPAKLQDQCPRKYRIMGDILQTVFGPLHESPLLPAQSVVPATTLVKDYLRLREYQKTRAPVAKTTRVPAYAIHRKQFINWVFSKPNADVSRFADFELTGIGLKPPSSSTDTPSSTDGLSRSSSAPHTGVSTQQRKKKKVSFFDFLFQKKRRKKRLKYRRISRKKINKYAQNRIRRNRRLNQLFVEPTNQRQFAQLFKNQRNLNRILRRRSRINPPRRWWFIEDLNYVNLEPLISPTETHLIDMLDRLPPTDIKYYTTHQRSVLPKPPKNPYPHLQLSVRERGKLRPSELVRPFIEFIEKKGQGNSERQRISEIREFAKNVKRASEETLLSLDRPEVMSLAETLKRKIPKARRMERLSTPLQKMLMRIRAYRAALKDYHKQKRKVTKQNRRYDALPPMVKDFHTFWDHDLPVALWNKMMKAEVMAASMPRRTAPLIEFPIVDDALTGDVWKRLITLFTGRVVTTPQPTVADFRALTRMMVGTQLTKKQAIRHDAIQHLLPTQVEQATRIYRGAGFTQFYALLEKLAGVGEGAQYGGEGMEFYPVLKWFYRSYLDAQKLYLTARRSNDLSKRIKHLGQKVSFNRCMEIALTRTPLHPPLEHEFAWFYFFTDNLMAIQENPALMKRLAEDLKKTCAREVEINYELELGHRELLPTGKINEPVLRALQVLKGKTDKLHRIKLPENFIEATLLPHLFRDFPRLFTERFARIPLTPEMRKNYPYGVKLAQAFSRMRMYPQVLHEIERVKSDASAFHSIPAYRDAFARVTPEMFGYCFPDMEGITDSKAFQISWFRYKLGKLSLWDAFRAMTKVRPLEVLLPPGFRFYNADIYGVPTLPVARRKGLVRANIFPSYEFKETYCALPPYKTLQKIYGDLDVSFLAEPPKTGYPFMSRQNILQQVREIREQASRLDDKARFAKEQEIERLTALKSSATPLQKAELLRLKKELVITSQGDFNELLLREEQRGQPYYYESDVALARKDGDVDVPDNVVRWLTEVLLSPMNWMKDRMHINFMGHAGFLRGDITTDLTEALQRGQGGIKPTHEPASLYHEAANPLLLSDNDLPSVFNGYEINNYVRGTSAEAQHQQRLEREREAEVLERKLEPLGEDFTRDLWERFNEDPSNPPEKYMGQLRTVDTLYYPQLTMDEWHEMYKAILAIAKDKPNAGITIDIPFMTFVAGSRPFAFTGKIRPGGKVTDPKIRARALAQVLMLANNPYYGSANDLEYRRLQVLGSYPPVSPTLRRRRPGPPIVWHYRIPFGEVCPETLGAPTIIERSHKRQPTLQTRTWLGYKKYAVDHLGAKPDRMWTRYIPAWVPKLIRLLPAGKRALDPKTAFQSNREPVHMYWWYVAAKVYFFALSFQLAKFIAYVVGKGTMYKVVLRLPLRSQRQMFRDFFLLIGVIKDERIRVIYDTPRRFTDLIGMSPELLARAGDIVLHLRNKRRPGGPTIPKGLLLSGPPGTGKTYLVQAIAGEAGVPVVAQSTNMYMDKTKFASPVYGLYTSFARARKLAPSILFIDEIDGMARSREAAVRYAATQRVIPVGLPQTARTPVNHFTRGPHRFPSSYVKPAEELFTIEERMQRERNPYLEDTQKELIPEYERNMNFDPEPTALEYFYKVLNVKAVADIQAYARFALLIELLYQLDGLQQYEGVLVMGATNRYSILDRAMVRPGRLEETILVPLPSFDQRTDIVKYYTAPFGYESDVSDNWEYLAHRTRGYSIADIATAINQSAVHAIVNNREMHDLDTLDFGLDQVERHKRIRGNLLPHPRVKRVPVADTIYFARQAYYQAGRALLHNILPTHPNLPYVTMEYLPFLPEQSLQKLFTLKMDRFEYEMRLAGLVAGKAAEYLFLYGTSFHSKKELAERQLRESDCGIDELGFATDMALHVVDTWLMLDEVRLNVLQETHISEEGDIPQLFDYYNVTDLPWLLESWLQERSKDYTHMFSKYDHPAFLRIMGQMRHLTKWVGETKIMLTTAVSEFSEWWDIYLKSPHERRSTIGWRERERWFQSSPRHRDPITAKNSQGNHGWMWRGKHWVREGDAWTEKTEEWLVGLTPPTDMNYLDQALPLVTYNDWDILDRDYLWSALMDKSFDLAYHLLDQHRPLLDRMAQRLHTKGRLRQFEIDAFIKNYTDTLEALRLIDPYETEEISRLAPLNRVDPNPVVYGARREGEFPSFLTRHNIDMPAGQYPYARQMSQQYVIRTRSTDELDDFLDMISGEDKIHFEKQIHDYNVQRHQQAVRAQAFPVFWHKFKLYEKYLQFVQTKIFDQTLSVLTRDAQNRQKEIDQGTITPPQLERKLHVYSYGPQGEFIIRGYRALAEPDPEKPITKEEVALILYTPPHIMTQVRPPSPDGEDQEQSEVPEKGPAQNPEA